MTVNELIALLRTIPGDLRISTRDGIDRVAVRDLIDFDHNAERVALLYHHNGGLVGFEPLTKEVLEKKTRDVLVRLSEPPLTRGSSRIFCNGRSRRLYSDFGGMEDWKYGDDIDPRIWRSMHERGFVEEHNMMGTSPFATITDAGRHEAIRGAD